MKKTKEEIACYINEKAHERGIIAASIADAKHPIENGRMTPFAISPDPMRVDVQAMQEIGSALHCFQNACLQIYRKAIVTGSAISWVAPMVEGNKPETLVAIARNDRTSRKPMQLFRPDLILVGKGKGFKGWKCAEIDVMPGSLGTSSALAQLMIECGVPGIIDCIPERFAEMTTELSRVRHQPESGVLFVTSEWSKYYADEARYLMRQLQKLNIASAICDISQIVETDAGIEFEGKRWPVIYRYFQLFHHHLWPDKLDALLRHFARGNINIVTPVHAPALEEKLWFALWRHPLLRRDFVDAIKDPHVVAVLDSLLPETWVIEPELSEFRSRHQMLQPLLLIDGRPIHSFAQLVELTKCRDEFVIKPSGFSELSTRCGDVTITPSPKEWQAAMKRGIESFQKIRYILQRYHKPQNIRHTRYDFATTKVIEYDARVRANPFYIVVEGQVHFVGGNATMCPANRSRLHGASDTPMVPLALQLPADVLLK